LDAEAEKRRKRAVDEKKGEPEREQARKMQRLWKDREERERNESEILPQHQCSTSILIHIM
jgi:hypothetical protein